MTHVDFAVVGGGIIGATIARELVLRAPHARVLVLEKDAVGSGASRRSAGLHFPRGATERVRHMASYSQAYYRPCSTLIRHCPFVRFPCWWSPTARAWTWWRRPISTRPA